MSNDTERATVEEIEICNCTNEQLERGETCGLAICPNAPEGGAPLPVRNPRMARRTAPCRPRATELTAER